MDWNRWKLFKKPVNTQFKRKGVSISCSKGKYEELSENYLDDGTVCRILCPSREIWSVIGKAGNIVKALREERQSKITVADSVQGLDERVIIFYSSSVKPPTKNDDDEELEPHCAGWTRL